MIYIIFVPNFSFSKTKKCYILIKNREYSIFYIILKIIRQ
ncbi:hypothetical protein ELI_2467 [Eubacterium callanderi]|uniref:Uncharacterized protein n=1 Tax=Eubacterium callanderi TaxID=53442 RepID=E3GNV9_9FIRM|nr:hypothetical protein ELI_2467 [Eubacterium callanderi]